MRWLIKGIATEIFIILQLMPTFILIQLSEPFKVFEFDFWKRPDSHGEVVMRIPATVDGKVHAVVSW